jgi:hypothetical protein
LHLTLVFGVAFDVNRRCAGEDLFDGPFNGLDHRLWRLGRLAVKLIHREVKSQRRLGLASARLLRWLVTHAIIVDRQWRRINLNDSTPSTVGESSWPRERRSTRSQAIRKYLSAHKGAKASKVVAALAAESTLAPQW